MTLADKIKQKIWNFVYKFFRALQEFLLKWKLISHKGRQRYHIGWLAQGRTLEEIKKHLHEKWNFGNHFIAWEDEGQVLSWRKLLDFHNQYHIRIFEDGEIRGHFELTPEAHPIYHFQEKGEEERNKEFMQFLGDFVTKEKHISHLTIDPHAYAPNSEITIENYEIYEMVHL